MKFFFHSATIAVSYVVGAFGILLDTVAASPDLLDDKMRQYVTDAIGHDPKHLGRVMLGISIAIFIARMRTLRK